MPLSPSPITLRYARDQLDNWLAAKEAASRGSSYSIADRSLTRQDMDTIDRAIIQWHNAVCAIQQRALGRRRSMFAQASFPTPGAGTGSQHHPWADGSN